MIIDMALAILRGKQVPPAQYTNHLLVLSEESIRTLDISTLTCETLPVHEYRLTKTVVVNPT